MDTLSSELDAYLTRMGKLHLLHDKKMEGYVRNLLFLLPPGDETILAQYYGILGHAKIPADDLARQHNMTLPGLQQLIERDIRQIAITPEWQMIKR